MFEHILSYKKKQVDELILLQQQLQRAQQQFLRDVSIPKPEVQHTTESDNHKSDEGSCNNAQSPSPVDKDELVAQLRSLVSQKIPLESKPASPPPIQESESIVVATLSAQLKVLQQQLQSERAAHQGAPQNSPAEQVASLNTQLSELHKQITSERNSHSEQLAALQAENRRLQDLVNKSNHDVAAALRKSGEEVAQQWQIQNELQGKLAEQTRVAQVATDKLLTCTNEMQQRDHIIATLQAKLREKQERLRDVAELANVRQRSESRELALHIDAMQEQYLSQGGVNLPECLSPGEPLPINKPAPSPDFSRTSSNNKNNNNNNNKCVVQEYQQPECNLAVQQIIKNEHEFHDVHHQQERISLPPNSLRKDKMQLTLPSNSLRDDTFTQPDFCQTGDAKPQSKHKIKSHVSQSSASSDANFPVIGGV